MWGHIDPEDQKCKHFFFYIPSEQPNQAQFFFCVYRYCMKSHKITEIKGTFFLLSKSRLGSCRPHDLIESYREKVRLKTYILTLDIKF